MACEVTVTEPPPAADAPAVGLHAAVSTAVHASAAPAAACRAQREFMILIGPNPSMVTGWPGEPPATDLVARLATKNTTHAAPPWLGPPVVGTGARTGVTTV